jgi:succinate dehydrogenase/fumarate reductase flavoprotein subunit
MERIKTDVLVFGAGGAGMRSALAAKEKNHILLVWKTQTGKSNCTIFSGGAVLLAVNGGMELEF